MQYLVTLYDVEGSGSVPGSPEWDADMEAYGAFDEKYGHAVRAGEALQPSSEAVTVRSGPDGGDAPLVTDGPFAETEEVIGGLYVVRSKSRDDAVAVAADVPTNPGGGVELRPIVDFG